MTLLDKTDFRTVIEDARARQAARVALIHANDNKSVALLRLYMTIGIASASGAIALLTSQQSVPKALGYALIVATLVAVAGAALCLRALRPADISLPGRDPEFWQWVSRDDVTAEHALATYLANLAGKNELNRTVNLRNSAALLGAKRCAVVLPLAALIAGLAAIFFKL